MKRLEPDSGREKLPAVTILAPVLTPHCQLRIVEAAEGLALEPIQASRLTSAFGKGAGHRFF